MDEHLGDLYEQIARRTAAGDATRDEMYALVARTAARKAELNREAADQ